MVCPFCLYAKTRITNSRPTSRPNQTWRRHACPNCKQSFTTRETIDLEAIVTVLPKKSRSAVPYQKSKLLFSLLRACDHRNDNEHTAFWLADTIEQQLLHKVAQNGTTISTKDIYHTATQVLQHFDQVAHIKYVSANEHITKLPRTK